MTKGEFWVALSPHEDRTEYVEPIEVDGQFAPEITDALRLPSIRTNGKYEAFTKGWEGRWMDWKISIVSIRPEEGVDMSPIFHAHFLAVRLNCMGNLIVLVNFIGGPRVKSEEEARRAKEGILEAARGLLKSEEIHMFVPFENKA